jgi:predicted metalloprotease with PDZ domain
MGRAGLLKREQVAAGLAGSANAVISGPGRQFRSAVAMSQMAPFTDAAASIDRTNFSTTFISYYTYGSAIALAMDLSLRDRSNGKISLDDYMRAMWRVHGKPGGRAAGLVAKPYTIDDARDRLAEVSGDRRFAEEFFEKYVRGREVVDYAPLLLRAGFVFRNRPGAWIGVRNQNVDGGGTITTLVPWGSPAFEAGLDHGDVILDVDGKPMAAGVLQAALKTRKPGDRLTVTFRRRGGATGTASIVVRQDPAFEAVPLESTGAALTPDQQRFRDEWLGSKVGQ